MVSKKYLSITVKGVDWKIYIQTHSRYIKMHGKDSKAIVYPDDREAYFDKSELALRIIRHEVFHIFTASTDTEHNSQMTVSDQEELDCTVYGNNRTEMIKIEDSIVDFILRAA